MVSSLLRGFGRWLLAAAALVVVRLLRRQRSTPPPSAVRLLPASPRAELLVVAALLGAAAAAIASIVVYLIDPSTQLLGASIGAALLLSALALGVAGSRLAAVEEAVKQRPAHQHDADREETVTLLREGSRPLTRRRVLVAAGAASSTMCAAAIVPLASLGPAVGNTLRRSPWRLGVALLDEQGRPVLAQNLSVGGFLTAFPANADPQQLAAPVVVCRVRPDELRLPAGRAWFAPAGICAFSKICTHAACAISLFRYPLSPTTTRLSPALVCPCHYSTFDVTRGGVVVFGPAVRSLPQLPLLIGPGGALMAAGPFTGQVGPSWWGVRER